MTTKGILQSGLVTPGHSVIWVTDNVVADGGAVPAETKVLASFRNADFNVTNDQPILLPTSIAAFQLTGIIVANASTPLTIAQGGFYTGNAKSGSVIVLASQSYAALTSPDLLMQPALTAFAQSARFSQNNLTTTLNADNLASLEIFFALSVPQGVSASADIYVLGVDLT